MEKRCDDSIFDSAMPAPMVLAFSVLLLLSTVLQTQPLSVPVAFCWKQCSVELDHVSQQYPATLWRKLTSSEPRREFAVQDVNLSLTSAFVLLLGDSSSGKTTIFKIILGKEKPSNGTVRIRMNDSDSSSPKHAIPVLLDQRPVYSNQRQSVEMILKRKVGSLLSSKSIPLEVACEKLVNELSNVLDLRLAEPGSDLSPSESYRCAIAEACLQSMLLNCEQTVEHTSFPAPILLMDEWMDSETGAVIQKVQSSLLNLVDRGALVISITHKPQLYKMDDKIRRISLNRGRILSSQ
eukprot:scaffold24_cov128-Cylindrotheca_fusiformis.AAC.12